MWLLPCVFLIVLPHWWSILIPILHIRDSVIMIITAWNTPAHTHTITPEATSLSWGRGRRLIGRLCLFCDQIPSKRRQAVTAWSLLARRTLDPPPPSFFFFIARTTAKSVRNPKPANLHPFMNLWRQQACGLLCSGLEDCVAGIPLALIFAILQGF